MIPLDERFQSIKSLFLCFNLCLTDDPYANTPMDTDTDNTTINKIAKITIFMLESTFVILYICKQIWFCLSRADHWACDIHRKDWKNWEFNFSFKNTQQVNKYKNQFSREIFEIRRVNNRICSNCVVKYYSIEWKILQNLLFILHAVLFVKNRLCLRVIMLWNYILRRNRK